MASNFFNSGVSLPKINEKIQAIKKLIESHGNHAHLINMLQTRYNEFTLILNDDAIKSEEKKPVLEQYHRFVSTVHYCLSSPNEAQSHIYNYFHRRPYYPVGIAENDTKNIPAPTRHPLAMTGVVLGAAVIIACLATLALGNPVVGLSLLALGLSILLPSLFMLLSNDPVDVTAKQKSEDHILQSAVLVGNMPVVDTSESDKVDSSISACA